MAQTDVQTVGPVSGPKTAAWWTPARRAAMSAQVKKRIRKFKREGKRWPGRKAASHAGLDRDRMVVKALAKMNGNKSTNKPGAKTNRFDGDARAAAVRRWQAGEGVQDIATSLGCNPHSIYEWANQLKNGRLGPSRGTQNRFNSAQRLAAVRRHLAGEKTEDIAREIGCTVSAIYLWKKQQKNEGSNGHNAAIVKHEHEHVTATGPINDEQEREFENKISFAVGSVSEWLKIYADSIEVPSRILTHRVGEILLRTSRR